MNDLGGRYRVIRELGKGATATVLLVYDEVLDRHLAVKKSKNKELLVQEGKVLASLSASFFPCLYDYKEEQKKGFLFLEYVQGESLKDRAERIGRFTVQEVLYIGLQIAEALIILHTGPKGHIYGDLKPENVMIQNNGKIKLIDFGAVCSLGETSAFRGGTRLYAPPEMWSSRPDVRNDIYSLGMVLKSLFLYGGREKSDLGYDTVRILEKCMQKDPCKRYQTMEQLYKQLKLLAEQDQNKMSVSSNIRRDINDL